MKDCCNQPVGLKDLENYLKRYDYLSGFSEDEQREIRDNIGAVSVDEVNPPSKYIEVTYDEAAYLVSKNKLIIGNSYLLTDFLSIYSSNVLVNKTYQTWGLNINPSPVCKLILKAITSNKFDRRVTMLRDDYPDSYKWIVEYDFDSVTLADGVSTKGEITFMKDCNNNTAFFNFKDYLMRRTKVELDTLGITLKSGSTIDLHTFNSVEDGNFKENSQSQDVRNNHIGANSTNNVFLHECYNNIFDGAAKDNTFAGDCINNHFGMGFSGNNIKPDIIYTEGVMKNKTVTSFESFTRPYTKRIIKYYEDYYLEYFWYEGLTNQFVIIP